MFLSRHLLAKRLKLSIEQVEPVLREIYDEQRLAKGTDFILKFTGPHSPLFVGTFEEEITRRCPKPTRKERTMTEEILETIEEDEEVKAPRRTKTSARDELMELMPAEPGVDFNDWLEDVENSDDEDVMKIIQLLQSGKYNNQKRHLRRMFIAKYGPSAPKAKAADLEAAEVEIAEDDDDDEWEEVDEDEGDDE